MALSAATKSIVECAGDDEEKEDYRVRERECLDYKAAVVLAQVESFCLAPPTRSTRAPDSSLSLSLSLSSPNSNQCRKASKRAIGMFFSFGCEFSQVGMFVVFCA